MSKKLSKIFLSKMNDKFLGQIKNAPRFNQAQAAFNTNSLLEFTGLGRELIVDLCATVNHPQFETAAAFEFKFGQDNVLRLTPNPTINQPGNAFLVDYPSYDDLGNMDLANFQSYFSNFLANPLNTIISQTDEWKLSVLLTFEIARRMKPNDICADLEIGPGILMALDSLPATVDFFMLFQGMRQYRLQTFDNICAEFAQECEKKKRSPEERLRMLMAQNFDCEIPSNN